jgi:hypothetical protein
LAIAIGRLWGDLGVCIQCWFLFPQVDPLPSFAFYHFLFAAILALDCLYIGLVWRERQAVRVAGEVRRHYRRFRAREGCIVLPMGAPR